MYKKISVLLVILTGLFLVSCSSKYKSFKEKGTFDNPVSIKDRAFVDGNGRQIIFNGINLVNKNPSQGYIGDFSDPEIFKKFKNDGFNIIRLGIIWAGLEPEPGVYDEEYLKRIDKQIKLAEENGIHVFLDMHQDLYSILYADGAPEWATLTEGKPHYTGSIWSDSYLISPAVQTAWDNFWNNTAASDGMGLQDHYAKAWKYVAKRYKGNNVVVGYDIMNEPFVGSEAQMYLPVLFQAFADVVKDDDENFTVDDIAKMWGDEDMRFQALKKISNKEKYKKVINSVFKINSKFEKGLLQNFYQKVADSIRTVDSVKILFFNHSYFCNMGVPTALEPVKYKNGKRDPNQAYSAHAYDLLVDTKYLSNSSRERLNLIFETIDKSGKRMNMPVIIGEWGALGSDVKGKGKLALEHLDIFEKYKFSNTYWAYESRLFQKSYYKYLLHPYPGYISGKLISYDMNYKTGKFVCKWKEEPGSTMPTSIYIPDIDRVDIDKISVKPEGNGIVVETFDNGRSGCLIIYPEGKRMTREIDFTVRKDSDEDIDLATNY